MSATLTYTLILLFLSGIKLINKHKYVAKF